MKNILLSAVGTVSVLLLVGFWALQNATTLRIEVVNTSEISIDHFDVTGPGITMSWQNINAGESQKAKIPPTHDGVLSFEATTSKGTTTGTLLGYVTPGQGGTVLVHYTPANTFEIENR